MALAIGSRLGSYEIVGALGAGGMGEVYRALDTKLGREVAIKTLPAALVADQDRLARFEREAKLLAALNHAHIASVYSLDVHDGTLYLAMELIEGQTLEKMLEAGPLAIEDALQLALQIAEALEAAHEKGVVHRDLKPANIMVTPNGVVKVLDFGLAKAFTGNPNEASPAHSPALSLAMTQQGLILGTAAYMSPEQASGQATDQRADIWAFGVVLYEMLTGMSLFGGESVPHVLADVLRSDPDWNRLPKDLHPRVKLLLERCLEKKVRNRYHSIADARIELEHALRPPRSAEASPTVRSPPLWRRTLPIAAAFAIGAIAAALAAWSLTPPAGSPTVARFDITPSDGLTVVPYSPSMAISPDGETIVYLAGGDRLGAAELRLRRLGQLDTSALTPPDGPRLSGPFFSPDGTQIGYYTTPVGGVAMQLKRVSVQGGPSSTITNLPAGLRGASWGADGTIVFGTDEPGGGLWRVRAAGGEPEPLTMGEQASGGTRTHMWPEVLPGGDAVLFAVVGATEEDSQIAVLSLATGEQRVVARGGTSPHYSPSGHVLFGRGGTLLAVPFDAARLEVRGDPVPVQEGVVARAADAAAEATLDSKGTLLYLSGARTEVGGRRLVWVDAVGRETAVPTPVRAYTQVVLSRDETRAAVTIEGDSAVWVADLSRGTLQRLGADLGTSGEPPLLFFSPDGRRVAAGARRDGRIAAVWVPTDGVGPVETLATLDESIVNILGGDLSADGRHFVLTVNRGSADLDAGIIGEPDSVRSFAATASGEAAPAISPSGNWIAYASNETGTFEEYLQRFPDGGNVTPISIGGAAMQHWSGDGRALSYLAGAPARLVRTSIEGLDEAGATPMIGAPVDLFPLRYYFVADARSHFDMSTDGERFLFIANDAPAGESNRLILVQNWAKQLEAAR